MSEEQTTSVDAPATESTEVQSVDIAARLSDVAGMLAGEETEPTKAESQPENKPEPEPKKYKVKVDGKEDEVDEDTLISGFQYAAHNTRKAQQLAEKERELAAHEGLKSLYDRMLKDQDFAKHVLTYGEKQQENTEDLDPITQIKREAVEEARKEFKKQQEQDEKKRLHEKINETFEQVTKDPLYNEVQQALATYVKSMPSEKMQRELYNELDQNPAFYLEMFNRAKESISKAKNLDITKQDIKPPVLMSGSSAAQGDDVPIETRNAENRKKLKAKFLKSGDRDALMQFFSAPGGIADRLAKGA